MCTERLYDSLRDRMPFGIVKEIIRDHFLSIEFICNLFPTKSPFRMEAIHVLSRVASRLNKIDNKETFCSSLSHWNHIALGDKERIILLTIVEKLLFRKEVPPLMIEENIPLAVNVLNACEKYFYLSIKPPPLFDEELNPHSSFNKEQMEMEIKRYAYSISKSMSIFDASIDRYISFLFSYDIEMKWMGIMKPVIEIEFKK